MRKTTAMAAGLLLAGCAAHTRSWERLDFEVADEALRHIEPLDLAAQATGPALTPEEAEARTPEDELPVPPPAETVALGLDDVRASALRRNLELQVRLVDPTIAATSIDEEQARFESTFRASASTSRTDSPTALGTEGSMIDTDFYNLGLTVPLRTGGTIDIDLPMSETSTNNPFALLDPAANVDLRFSISQPLLRNAGFGPNLHGVRVARGETMISGVNAKLAAVRILANADRAYWRTYAAREELEVRRREYELAREQLATARRRVDAGDLPEIEVVRARSGLASRLEAIIRAASALSRRQRELKQLVNRPDLPVGGPTFVEPATSPTPMWYDLDADRLADRAVANRLEMLELELRLALDASSIDFARNQALPLFLLDYTYNISGLAGNFGNAFDQIPPHSFEDWSVGLRAEIPIGNEAAKARVHRAVLTRLQRLATREQRVQSIRTEVYDVLDTLRESWQRILAARVEARLAGRTLEAERRQFELGLRTSTDVLDAATRLSDAQSREVAALTDYEIARIDLAFATGTLLGNDGVEWTWE